MVKYQDPVSLTFAALSDPTAARVLSALARGPATVSELAARTSRAFPECSSTCGCFGERSSLETAKNGRVRRCGIKPAPMRAAQRYLDGFSDLWERRFDSLERVVRKMEAEKR
jgi:DNA-binding transcriptional ArsR family regulator